MRGGTRELTVTRQEHCRGCKGVGALHVQESRCLHCQGSGAVKSARGHMVFSQAVRALRRLRPAASDALSDVRRAAGGNAQRGADDCDAGGPGRRRADPRAGQGARRAQRRRERRSVHHRPRRTASVLSAATATICTWWFRWRCTRRRSAQRSTCRRSRALRALRVPPGTQSGQRFRLRERGVPSPRDGHRGDLVVEVRLVTPPVLDERSKELMREFGRINNDDVRRTLNEHKGH